MWLIIGFMRHAMPYSWLIVLFSLLSRAVLAEPYVYPGVPLRDLPNALHEAYIRERPNLGEIGRCVVAFDSTVVQEKMIFTCSIYVKMSAVAERKAMERCEGMRETRGIKGPCRVVND